MDRERILGILREHEPELKAAGVLHLRLFGSVARGENTLASDVDLLFDCSDTTPETLLRVYGLEDRVTDLLGLPAHLSSSRNMKPQIRERVLPEALIAFRDPQLCFTEMLESIAAIHSFLIGVDLQRYRSNLLIRSAVERQLQILTEAAFRLGDDAERLCPTVDWRGIRGLGNVLRHSYDVVDDALIWEIVEGQLPRLKEAASEVLLSIEARGAS